eukprot:g7807.t1
MVAALANTLAGMVLALAWTAYGFVAPTAISALHTSTRPCCQQHHQQRFAFAPQPPSPPPSSFLGRAGPLVRVPAVGARRRRLVTAEGTAAAAGAGAAAIHGCGVVGDAGAATAGATTMRLGSLAPRRMAFAALANAAAFATVGGGVLAGGLHAVSGPDHLAALLPRIMGQKWHNSMRIGATWGLGHGFSATVIGLAAFFFKDRLGLGHNQRLVAMMGTWTEGLVGNSAAGGSKAIFLNGVLHGFSWDGAPSLAPALALSSWGSVLWFLLAYCSGTMVAMSATTTLIGEGSVRVGKALDQPDIPRKLSVVSSFVAITIGAVWLAKAVFF